MLASQAVWFCPNMAPPLLLVYGSEFTSGPKKIILVLGTITIVRAISLSYTPFTRVILAFIAAITPFTVPP